MTFLRVECGKNLNESIFYRKVKIKRKQCLNKKLKSEVFRNFYTKKILTTHIEREHHLSECKAFVLEKPSMTAKNNRTLIVGRSFLGKTHLMLKFLSQMSDRDFYTINKSPSEQYANSEIKIKGIGEEKEPLNEYESAIIVFDEILGSSDCRYKEQIFTRGQHNNLDICYLPQSYFDLPKKELYEIIVKKTFCLTKD